jgi:hypothetical protein
VKVSIEIHSETARLAVAVQAKSIRQALSIVAAPYPGSVTSVKFPIDPEGFSSSISPVWAVEDKAQAAPEWTSDNQRASKVAVDNHANCNARGPPGL